MDDELAAVVERLRHAPQLADASGNAQALFLLLCVHGTLSMRQAARRLELPLADLTRAATELGDWQAGSARGPGLVQRVSAGPRGLRQDLSLTAAGDHLRDQLLDSANSA